MPILTITHELWIRYSLLHDEDVMVLDPTDLLGKQLHFKLYIPAAHNLQWILSEHSRGSYVK